MGDAAIGGDVLILLAHRLAQEVHLMWTGLLGQRRGRHQLALVRVDRPQQDKP